MSEKKYLAIPALILSDLALMIAWLPLINKLSLVFMAASCLLALISLIINWRSHKSLTLASLITSLVALGIYLLSTYVFHSAINQLEETLTPIAQELQKLLSVIP